MRPWFLLLLLTACAPKSGDTNDTTSADDTDTQGCDPCDTGDTQDTDTQDTDTQDTDPPATDDEALVRAMIAGEKSPDEVIPTVAWSGGFPVKTSAGTYLFVNWYDKGSWSVAGDFSSWSEVPMTKGDGFYWAEVAVPSPDGSRYKFVQGGSDWAADPWARSYTYDENGEISFVEPPTDAYRLDRWPGLQAEGLAARDLRVYVPPGKGPWPVLYMHDGQNLFDPDGIWGGWHMQDAVAADGVDVLIVGIDNTADRMTEYTQVDDEYDGYHYVAEGAAYAKLVTEDVKPFVEQQYGSTGLDGVMGSSLGGLISLYIADQYPSAYDFAGSLSGTLGWGKFELDNPIIEQSYLAAGHRDFVIYVDSGGDDGGDGCTDPNGDGFPVDDPNASDNYCDTRAFADAMAEENGYTWDSDLYHWWEPEAEHNEMYWAARVYRPLAIFEGVGK